jgi:hypothetical protein
MQLARVNQLLQITYGQSAVFLNQKHIIKAEMADSVPARSFSQGGPPTLFQVTPCALFQSLYAFFKKMYRLF